MNIDLDEIVEKVNDEESKTEIEYPILKAKKIKWPYFLGVFISLVSIAVIVFCNSPIRFNFIETQTSTTTKKSTILATTEQSILLANSTTSKTTTTTTMLNSVSETDTNTSTATTITTHAVTESITTTEAETTVTTEQTTKPDITGVKTALVYSVMSGKIIYEKNSNDKISTASLLKLLTACVALKYSSPDNVYTVGDELKYVHSGSSICLLKEGHKLTLNDLITGMLLASGNDAAYTIAVNVARDLNSGKKLTNDEAVAYFCKLMNDYAKSIGMKNSHFVNPDGWDDENQYSTTSDLLLLAKKAMSIPLIKKIVAYDSKYVVFESGQNITWKNSNRLIDKTSDFYMKNAIGIKTGSTNKAGNSIIAGFEVSGKTYIIIVTGCKTDSDRYKAVHEIYNEYLK